MPGPNSEQGSGDAHNAGAAPNVEHAHSVHTRIAVPTSPSFVALERKDIVLKDPHAPCACL